MVDEEKKELLGAPSFFVGRSLRAEYLDIIAYKML